MTVGRTLTLVHCYGVRHLIEEKANWKSLNLTSPPSSLSLARIVNQNKPYILGGILMPLFQILNECRGGGPAKSPFNSLV